MSQSDPKSKKPEASTPSTQQAATTPKSPEKAKTAAPAAKPSGNSWIVALIVVVVVAAGVSALILRSPKSSPPVASASEEMEATDDVIDAEATDAELEPEEEPVEEEAAATAASSAPTTGTLVVRSDVEGADVFLNGKRVGKTPHQAKGLKPGSYDVRVEKDGYQPYQKKMDVAPKRQELSAKLTPASASLKVASNVAGATVLIDGEEKGATPLSIQDLAPGRHELTIAADGYRTHTETLELEGGAREVSVDLVSPLADLNEAVAVKHKHRFGSCEGVLRATASGIVYESEHKDAFSVELTGVSEMSLDGDELSLKVEGGRNYDFKERNDNVDALSGFYNRVQEAVRVGKESS